MNVCAFGFETNGAHTDKLQAIEEAYSNRGWRTHFFTQTGVGFDFSSGEFVYDENAAAAAAANKFTKAETARVRFKPPQDERKSYAFSFVDIAEFVHLVAGRRLPITGNSFNISNNVIVAKMDMEGSEFLALPHLLISGALCKITFLSLEMHPVTALLELTREKLSAQFCSTTIDIIDDERYGGSDYPLPRD